jgi:tRNA nucleotidyltransferase (CCA-adding enzyme)
MDALGNVLDAFDGLDDLRDKIIRTIGDPFERFEEDALRLLRAFRFSAKLGFDIDPETLKAIKVKAPLIQEVSIERIQNELSIMVKYPSVLKTVKLMISSGFADHLFNLKPGLEALTKYHELSPMARIYTIYKHVALDQSPWVLPNKVIRQLKTLQNLESSLEKGIFPRLLLEYDEADFHVLNEIMINEVQSSLISSYHQLKDTLVITSKKELAINGKELDESLNLTDKSMIQPLLDALIDAVLELKVKNDKKALLTYAKTFLEKSL